jgi:predicted transcriptional regulator
MKKMQSYRIDTDIIKIIDALSKKTNRTKSNVIEEAIKDYFWKIKQEEMNKKQQQTA